MRLRTDRDLSLDAFASRTGYSRSSWNRVFNGQAFPPRSAVAELCAFRKPETDLLGLWEEADKARKAAKLAQVSPPEPEPAAEAAGETAEGETEAQQAPAAPSSPVETAGSPAAEAETGVPAGRDTEPETGKKGNGSEEKRPPSSPPGPEKSRQRKAGGRDGRNNRIRSLAVLLVGLSVLLLAGRWYVNQDNPDDTQPPPVAAPSESYPSKEVPRADPEDSQDDRAAGQGSSAAPGSAMASDTEETPESDTSADTGRQSSKETPKPPAASAVSASPSATAETLGAAGRANCRYNWDRTQTMAKGMVGSKVKQIQCLLNNNYDYSLAVDGNFGTGTETAVKAVQSCSGLTPDGQVGPQTWKYLDTPMSGCGH
ncbi:peptidoglycan-binding protein [Streptomyces fungicidicus]|uniref:peptidoglycan-binding protein n=1 Tax=Streptomyces fungicidicus TaxID=68203 RepID=UPI0033F1F6C3